MKILIFNQHGSSIHELKLYYPVKIPSRAPSESFAKLKMALVTKVGFRKVPCNNFIFDHFMFENLVKWIFYYFVAPLETTQNESRWWLELL